MNLVNFDKEEIENEKISLLSKIENFSKRNNLNYDMVYLKKQIDAGMKNIVYCEYTDEEKDFKRIVALRNNNSNLNDEEKEELDFLINQKYKEYSVEDLELIISRLSKEFELYNSGQYLAREQKVIYTNYNENLNSINNLEKLKTHEEIHAITQGVLKENEMMDIFSFINNIDNINDVEAYTIISGYAEFSFEKNGHDKGIKGLSINASKNSTFMEMCVESISGMINEENKKEFTNYSIPSEMSAYFWTNNFRDLFVMSLGNSDFITDMLREDRIFKLRELNESIKTNYNSNILDNINRLLNESGNPNLGKEVNDNATAEIERECLNIFLTRIKNLEKLDEDTFSQIEYFSEHLISEELKLELNNYRSKYTSLNKSKEQKDKPKDEDFVI